MTHFPILSRTISSDQIQCYFIPFCTLSPCLFIWFVWFAFGFWEKWTVLAWTLFAFVFPRYLVGEKIIKGHAFLVFLFFLYDIIVLTHCWFASTVWSMQMGFTLNNPFSHCLSFLLSLTLFFAWFLRNYRKSLNKNLLFNTSDMLFLMHQLLLTSELRWGGGNCRLQVCLTMIAFEIVVGSLYC